MKSLRSKILLDSKSLLYSLLGAIILTSCRSEVEVIIGNARRDFSEFEEILNHSDTIPSERMNNLDSSLSYLKHVNLTESQFKVVNNLGDSIALYRVWNTRNKIMLELLQWEKEFEGLISKDSFDPQELEEIKESMAVKSQNFIEYLNENRENLSAGEIQRINDILGKQYAIETKEILKSLESGVNDFVQRSESWLNSLVDELER
jgi:hypothetical protein